MTDIHPTAVVEDGARLADGVTVGPFTVIGPDVELAEAVSVQSHVVINGHTRIGARTQIFPFAAIGGPPQDTSYTDEPTKIVIGSDCVIREQATVNRGTARGKGVTTIGDRCMLMIGAHVAHDCVVSDDVLLVNNATLGGHSEIGEHAILGGLSAVQQNCRVGAHAFIGGVTGVTADVIPFVSALGHRAEIAGLNIVGLKRRGFDRPTIHALRAAYKAVFDGTGSRGERLDRVAEEYADIPAAMTIVAFIRAGGDRRLALPRD
ncbi:acyl-ACP--UDP-N-acetylglucosamine O-acyltransferase [Bauldia sp.]|uniref:acyl-ACP--UDP-N-acetylglucosamine O-acyltransferase n=1 Tax=Bauldia sp. TaxID=2575872 RepID=UPI003BA9C269